MPCFQFIGFPSEWGVPKSEGQIPSDEVSNLLGSPASGEATGTQPRFTGSWRFQFIGFPSEWGALMRTLWMAFGGRLRFQFIGFPSEWGVDVSIPSDVGKDSFQFIGFPSEWGALAQRRTPSRLGMFPIYWVPQRVGSPPWAFFCFPQWPTVSNLLGSPASGELR